MAKRKSQKIEIPQQITRAQCAVVLAYYTAVQDARCGKLDAKYGWLVPCDELDGSSVASWQDNVAQTVNENGEKWMGLDSDAVHKMLCNEISSPENIVEYNPDGFTADQLVALYEALDMGRTTVIKS